MQEISSKTASSRMIRVIALGCIYLAFLSLSLCVAYELRFDFEIPLTYRNAIFDVALVIVLAKIGLLIPFRQFGSLLTYFSIPDLLRIVAAMALGDIIPYVARPLLPALWTPPRGVVLIDFIISVALLSGLRLLFRIGRERFSSHTYRPRQNVRRIVVCGAGDAGARFVNEILSKPHLGLKAAFFIDDNVSKHHRSIHGIPVLGSPANIADLCRSRPVDMCVIAMPTAPGKRVQEILHLMNLEGLKVEIIPSLAELATGRSRVTKIRPVEVEDLLGRPTTEMRSDEVAQHLYGKTVFVTGAGGSIGSELCRQIARYNPLRLVLIERCEVQIFTIEQELISLGFSGMIVPLVADICNKARIEHIFARFRPSIVYHAAAHKHVPMMEHQPYEALQNNTFGTKIIAEMAIKFSVDRFVLVSTDKAINPTNIMGASKRLAEMLLQSLQSSTIDTTKFMAVRFGNVLGSSGSVVPTFKNQIARGGPITITHPDITRYFMTIPEAVGLVLQAGSLGKGGEIFVLDMGSPIKIVDLARQLIELSGLQPDIDIAIEFIGLRPGEKLFEEINHQSENLVATNSSKIMKFLGPASSFNALSIQIEQLRIDGMEMDSDALKIRIKQIIPEYSPYISGI